MHYLGRIQNGWHDQKRLAGGRAVQCAYFAGTLIADLLACEHPRQDNAKNVGVVKTGVAVRSGDKTVDVSTAEKLKATLQSAKDI